MTPRRKYQRGYPVAVLIGLAENQAVLWAVYSRVVKAHSNISLFGMRSDSKALYKFHEAIVNAVRPAMKEGIKSLILAAPARTDYAAKFASHIRGHHAWLIQGANKAVVSEITGDATTLHEVTVLTRLVEFKELISKTTCEETENLLELLEKRLNASSSEPLVLYSVEEIEEQIYGEAKPGKPRPEYLLITDSQLSSPQKRRLNRLMQIAANKQIKTRVVASDTPAGKRLAQLGGVVCLEQLDV
ncbi:MAG: hypothetical protein NWF04_03160 [Candidatus Bathyarchaeota archaeon]|nr:hypothetical protein [Candidatus Bathyarchaeota archaeon]